jgi:hypothetical protein
LDALYKIYEGNKKTEKEKRENKIKIKKGPRGTPRPRSEK